VASGNPIFHTAMMIVSLVLGIVADDINDVERFTSIVWIFFWLHFVVILTLAFTHYFLEMHRNITRVLQFIVTIGYQVGVFYSLTEYVEVFEKYNAEVPKDMNHGKKLVLSPLHMKNILQFWIVAEITAYTGSIISIMIILSFASCLKLKREKPISKTSSSSSSQVDQNTGTINDTAYASRAYVNDDEIGYENINKTEYNDDPDEYD
jgi:hypothetical protein